MEYTRNSDPEYYNKNRARANCGSYALRLNEWYDPEEYFEDIYGSIYDWIEEKGSEEYSDSEITDIYSSILIEGMLQEFEGELELCDGWPPSEPNKELIAFNTFCHWDDGVNWTNYDFHFKVFRDGKWSEKCGCNEVQDCEEDDWGRYIGEPCYFYHTINI